VWSQVGGGMVGMLIVEDAADEIPSDLADLPEKLVMIERFQPHDLVKLAKEFDSDMGDGWTSVRSPSTPTSRHCTCSVSCF